MRITDPMSKFLAIPGFSVVHVERIDPSEIWLELESLSSRHRCPLCRGPGTRYDCVYRQIQDLPFGVALVFLLLPVERILCPRCGVHQVRLSWTAPGARRTRRLDHSVYLMTEETTVSFAACFYSLSWDTVHRIEVRFARERLRGRFRGPYRKIGIDEVSYGKRHRYLTIVTDLERRRVIWIGKNRRGMVGAVLGASRRFPSEVVDRSLCSLFAAWFPGGATSSRPCIRRTPPLSEPCLRVSRTRLPAGSIARNQYRLT